MSHFIRQEHAEGHHPRPVTQPTADGTPLDAKNGHISIEKNIQREWSHLQKQISMALGPLLIYAVAHFFLR